MELRSPKLIKFDSLGQMSRHHDVKSHLSVKYFAGLCVLVIATRASVGRQNRESQVKSAKYKLAGKSD